MEKIYKYLDDMVYWSILIIPFSLAIVPAIANISLGLLLFSFLSKRLINKKIYISVPCLICLFHHPSQETTDFSRWGSILSDISVDEVFDKVKEALNN